MQENILGCGLGFRQKREGRRGQGGPRNCRGLKMQVWLYQKIQERGEDRVHDSGLPFGPRSQASLQKAQGPGVCIQARILEWVAVSSFR